MNTQSVYRMIFRIFIEYGVEKSEIDKLCDKISGIPEAIIVNSSLYGFLSDNIEGVKEEDKNSFVRAAILNFDSVSIFIDFEMHKKQFAFALKNSDVVQYFENKRQNQIDNLPFESFIIDFKDEPS